jgi:uncharacterized membrane protein (DUF4010 family)
MAALARDGGTNSATAAGAIVVAAIANTLTKCGIIVALASRALRLRILAATAAIVAAALLTLLLR